MTNRLTIAIDCDDVLIETTPYLVESYNRQYQGQVTLANAHLSKNPEWQSNDRAEVFRRLHQIQLSREFGELLPLSAAIKTVNALAQLHNLHLVTARSPEVMAATNQMIERYFDGCFTSVEHVGSDRPKGVCAQLKADIMVDDNLDYLETVVAHGTPLAIWFGDYPWQKAHQNTSLPVTRCATWGEVEYAVGRYAGW